MNLDPWRGRGGLVGWLILRWDVWQIQRFVRSTVKNGPNARG
jgi:hypothetical protein